MPQIDPDGQLIDLDRAFNPRDRFTPPVGGALHILQIGDDSIGIHGRSVMEYRPFTQPDRQAFRGDFPGFCQTRRQCRAIGVDPDQRIIDQLGEGGIGRRLRVPALRLKPDTPAQCAMGLGHCRADKAEHRRATQRHRISQSCHRVLPHCFISPAGRSSRARLMARQIRHAFSMWRGLELPLFLRTIAWKYSQFYWPWQRPLTVIRKSFAFFRVQLDFRAERACTTQSGR